MGILNLASKDFWKILRKNGLYGSIPPGAILDYMRFNAKFSDSLTVPDEGSGLNIHMLESNEEIHYVVSQKLYSKSKSIFKIYDSLPSGARMWTKRLRALPKQLEMIYGEIPQLNDIEVICPQSQGYNSNTRNNSGLYALANFIMLSNGQDPINFKLAKNMRAQLKNMITDNGCNFKLFKVSPLDDLKFGRENIQKGKNIGTNAKGKENEWRSPTLCLKKIETDEDSFIHCNNKFDILSQLSDLKEVYREKSKKENEERERERKKKEYKVRGNEKREKMKKLYEEKEREKKKNEYEDRGREKMKKII